jgi:hypothetical protein
MDRRDIDWWNIASVACLVAMLVAALLEVFGVLQDAGLTATVVFGVAGIWLGLRSATRRSLIPLARGLDLLDRRLEAIYRLLDERLPRPNH